MNLSKNINVNCLECQKQFFVFECFIRKGWGKFCCRSCKAKWFSKNHESTKATIKKCCERKKNFKKTRTVPRKNNEYLRFQKDGIRYYVHRYIMENHIGRKLKSTEHVHHINENPKDNRIENLMLTTSEEHQRIHKNNN